MNPITVSISASITSSKTSLFKVAIDSFDVRVYIWSGLRSNRPHSRPFQRRTLLSQSCFQLSCYSFFGENSQNLLRRELSHPNIPRQCISYLVSEAMEFGRSLIEDPRHFAFHNPPPSEIPLVIDVVFITPSFEASEHDLTARNMRNSVEVRKNPAPKRTADELLNKAKYEGDDETDNCSICFAEFNKDEEVSATPCQHWYHQECIVKWLKTSPVCPLCRHPLPVM